MKRETYKFGWNSKKKKKGEKFTMLKRPGEKLLLQKEIEGHQEGRSSIVKLIDKQETSDLLLMIV
jgi:hypothetical protein